MWGIGLKSKKWKLTKWIGSKAQGFILMKVRDELRDKFGISVEVDMDFPPENTLHELATQTLTASIFTD